jgi:hypothetical protein
VPRRALDLLLDRALPAVEVLVHTGDGEAVEAIDSAPQRGQEVRPQARTADVPAEPLQPRVDEGRQLLEGVGGDDEVRAPPASA